MQWRSILAYLSTLFIQTAILWCVCIAMIYLYRWSLNLKCEILMLCWWYTDVNIVNNFICVFCTVMITDSHIIHIIHHVRLQKHQGWTKFTAQNFVGSANQLPALPGLKDGGKPKMPKLLLNILNCTIITRPHVKRKHTDRRQQSEAFNS